MAIRPFTPIMLPRALSNSSSLFESFFGFPPSYELATPMQSEVFGSQDVQRREDGSLEVSIDLPGVKKEDIKVEVTDDVLNVSATRFQESEEKDDKGVTTKRRSRGAVHRSWTLPEGLDPKDIQVSNENGVLKLEIPPVPEESKKSKTISLDIK